MKYSKTFSRIVLALLILCGVATAYSYRWDISDWWKTRGYSPSMSIKNIATHTTMTAKAQRIFYASDPQLQDKVSFNKTQCARENYSTLVLGCYEPARGIFVLHVTDPRLKGEVEVTAAHEMLHAVYQRMSAREKNTINALLETELGKTQDDRIKKLVESYRKSEPTSVDNELHSIFGTEVRQLSPRLEAHYKAYFTHRVQVVAYSEAYQQIFLDIQSQVKSYDERLETLKLQIDGNKAALKTLQTELVTMRASLDTKKNTGDISGYNAGVAPFNAKVAAYNALVATTTEQVDQYNALVEERNAVALEQLDLVQALDSKSIDTTAP